MASKRHIRRRSCQNKRRYETHGEAMYQTIKMNRNRNDKDVRPYHCYLCNGWHVGHPKFDGYKEKNG